MILFHLISMQDATESYHYPDLVERHRGWNQAFFPLEHVQLVVLGERLSSVGAVGVDKIGVIGKNT